MKNLALRRWPLENYVELSKKLLGLNKKVCVLLFGSDEEKKENETISAVNPERIKIVDEKEIKKSAAIIGKCKIFLSVDTALMHIASAVFVKLQLIIETPSFNETVYPYNKKFTIIKNQGLKKDKLEYYKYDGEGIKAGEEEIKEIMASVSVDNVFEEIKKALK
jgi:ADP-heptose:LPS heptosyltransferase